MNGAAKSYQQEEGHHGLNSCSEARGYGPGYHLDMNHPQHSKAMNFDNHSVDTYLFKHADQYSRSRDHQSVHNRGEEGPRHQYKVPHRIPLELPVPKFEIDENYVGESIRSTSLVSLPTVENSSELDLDTRIDFLIKSKALAGMHPIFSQLESEESSCEFDDPYEVSFKSKKKKRRTRSPLPVEHVEQFDDPEMPLSRPPSPFLSRATYLFWFNKAIELKKQAKELEQELLEKAAKKLLQENSTSGNKTDKGTSNHEIISLPKNVLDEVCSELKEIVKNEFIKEVFEDAIFNTLEHWWESNCKQKSAINPLSTSTIDSASGIARLKAIKNDVTRIKEDTNEVSDSQMEIRENVQKFNPLIEIMGKMPDLEDSANVEGQCCSSPLNTMDIGEYSVSDTTSYNEENENNVFNEVSACVSFNHNAIPRINQPILDESTLFLPFPSPSEVPEVLTQRLDKNDDDKNEIVVNILNQIFENVFHNIKT